MDLALQPLSFCNFNGRLQTLGPAYCCLEKRFYAFFLYSEVVAINIVGFPIK